jgi:hypothetical protein
MKSLIVSIIATIGLDLAADAARADPLDDLFYPADSN